MKKVNFKNKIYYYSLILILAVLLIVNVRQLLAQNWKMIIPVIVQILLLFMIFSKNHYSRIAIKIWLIILLITGSIQLFLDIFYLFARETNLSSLWIRIIFILVEILLLSNLKSVEIIDEEQAT